MRKSATYVVVFIRLHCDDWDVSTLILNVYVINGSREERLIHSFTVPFAQLPQSVRDLSWVTFLIRNFTVPNHWNIPRLLKHAASSRSASQRIVNEKEIGSWAVTSNGTQSERLRIFAFQNVRECRK